MTDENQRIRTQFRLSQEMIAIVTVGIALAGLNLATVGDLREEARADRAVAQAEGQADRTAWQAESRQLRDEARAEREAFRHEGEAFRREILRLTQEQAELAAVVDSTRTQNQ